MAPKHMFAKWSLAALTLIAPPCVQGGESLAQFAAPGILVVIARGLRFSEACAMVIVGCLLGTGCAWAAGAPEALLWMGQTAGLAMIMLLARRQGWSAPLTILAGLVYLSAAFCAALALHGAGDIGRGYAKLFEALSADLDRTLAIYQNAAADIPKEDIKQWMDAFRTALLRFLPGMMGLIFLTMAITNVFVARKFLPDATGDGSFGPEFQHWKLPDHLVWPPIGAAGLILLGPENARFEAENALMAFSGLYFLQGLAIISFYLIKLKTPVLLRWLVYILISIQWYGLVSVAILGFADVWANLRSVRLTPAQPGA